MNSKLAGAVGLLLVSVGCLTTPIKAQPLPAETPDSDMDQLMRDVQSAGMVLLQCRNERAALVCAETPAECDLIRLTISGGSIASNGGSNRMIEQWLTREEAIGVRLEELRKLRLDVQRCQTQEDVPPLDAIIDAARRLRRQRSGK